MSAVTVAAALQFATLTAASAAVSRERAEQSAFDYLRASYVTLGLTADDVADLVSKDLYSSAHNGVTHVYLRQRHRGIEVAGTEITLYVTADGHVHHVSHRLLSGLASRAGTSLPSLSAADAETRAAADLALSASVPGPALRASLIYHLMADGSLRLAWDLMIDARQEPEFCGTVVVDAVSGEILDRTSWTTPLVPDLSGRAALGLGSDGGARVPNESMSPDGYQVFAIPKEHPDDGPRTLEADPAELGGAASPFGWHDTDGVAGEEFSVTRGNNAHAYTDTDNNNVPDPGSSPDGAQGLHFDFPLNLALAPSTYRPAAVTNAFYWTNVVHDVLWRYGFNEPAGSFQTNNYGRGGLGNDAVLVEVQDGSGLNNGTITTPLDGSAPRMQLYLWNTTSPFRDGALANGIIASLYGYGAAQRLVGGPNSSCLNQVESAGLWWGWADWIGLVLTANPSDTETTPRGVGTYLLGQPPTGLGIRPRHYTTDFAVNDLTHGDVAMSGGLVHTIGTTWCTMLWQVYWELVDDHGFNSEIYSPWTSGGNNLALQLIIDGMKLAPCTPGFVDARDAILAADVVLTGGLNGCAIWRAFAVRGLGASASQGSANSYIDGVEAFDLPAQCEGVAVGDGPPARAPSTAHTLQVHPNPFYPRTNLSITLVSRGEAVLEIYDLQGRLVRRIEAGVLDAGRHQFGWDGRDGDARALISGEYIVRLTVDGKTASTRKTMLVR
jgi:hypothetical protein